MITVIPYKLLHTAHEILDQLTLIRQSENIV